MYRTTSGHCALNHHLAILRATIHPAIGAWAAARIAHKLKAVKARHGKMRTGRLEADWHQHARRALMSHVGEMAPGRPGQGSGSKPRELGEKFGERKC